MDIRSKIVEVAKTYIGTPYSKLDCSAFCREVFRQFDYELPRVSASQAKHIEDLGLAERIPKSMSVEEIVKKLKPGMVIAWGHPNWYNTWRMLGIHHISIYSGDGNNVESAGKGVQERKVWETSKWQIVLIGDITSLLTGEPIIESEVEEVIKQGDKGEEVYLLQQMYDKAGYTVLEPGANWADWKLKDENNKPIINGHDASFGPYMALVTADIQDKHGLPKTGEADTMTMLVVASEIKATDDEYVKMLEQTVLDGNEAFKEIAEIAKINIA